MMPSLIATPRTSLSTANGTGQTAIFLHIPKTAGSTLSEIVLRQFEPQQVIWLRQPRIIDSAAEFAGLSDARKQELKFILGHVGYGLHELTPNRCTYLTVLREPVDRVVSYYYYILRTPVHFMYPATSKLTLKEFAASQISNKVSNGQTKYLAEMDAKECTSDTLAVAKRHLEHFAVAGLIEQFDETLMMMRRALGWNLPFYVRENVTRKRPKAKEIARDVRDVIERHNEFDMALYEWVSKRHNESVRDAGLSLKYSVSSFRALNRLYGSCRSAWGAIKSLRPTG